MMAVMVREVQSQLQAISRGKGASGDPRQTDTDADTDTA